MRVSGQILPDRGSERRDSPSDWTSSAPGPNPVSHAMLPLWHHEPLELHRLTGDHRADVCVIGLGGSGLAAIREARSLGLSVIGIDARQVAAGAAGRNGGFLLAGPPWFHHEACKRFGREIACDLYRATTEQIAVMASETDAVRIVGSVRVAASDEEREDIEAHREALLEDGLPADVYDGPEGEGLLIPTDGVFDPFRHCQQLAAMAIDEGAQLFGDTPALEIGSRAIRCREGSVQASTILACVDGGLGRLFPELPVRTWRLQMLGTAPIGRTLTEHAVYRNFGYQYWQQLADGRLVLGGGRDMGGDAEETTEEAPSQPVQDHLDGLLARLDADVPVTHRWAGIVSYSEDGLPIVEEVQPGVWVAGAYCGTGNVIGALVGRDLALRAAGRTTPFVDLLGRARTLTSGPSP